MKSVIFDLDETLLDRTHSLREFVLWQARGMLRDSVEDANEFSRRFIELDSHGRVWKDVVYARLKDEFCIQNWSVEELLASYELCFCGFCKLMPNAKEALQSLHVLGYKLGLVSNGKSPFQERNFHALGIDHLFSTVIVSDAVGIRKPDPRIFSLACKKLLSSPKASIFVGDSPKADIDGANNSGLYTIYFSANAESTNADAVCTNYNQLVKLVSDAT